MQTDFIWESAKLLVSRAIEIKQFQAFRTCFYMTGIRRSSKYSGRDCSNFAFPTPKHRGYDRVASFSEFRTHGGRAFPGSKI
jgi:hypothetical protein